MRVIERMRVFWGISVSGPRHARGLCVSDLLEILAGMAIGWAACALLSHLFNS